MRRWHWLRPRVRLRNKPASRQRRLASKVTGVRLGLLPMPKMDKSLRPTARRRTKIKIRIRIRDRRNILASSPQIIRIRARLPLQRIRR